MQISLYPAGAAYALWLLLPLRINMVPGCFAQGGAAALTVQEAVQETVNRLRSIKGAQLEIGTWLQNPAPLETTSEMRHLGPR